MHVPALLLQEPSRHTSKAAAMAAALGSAVGAVAGATVGGALGAAAGATMGAAVGSGLGGTMVSEQTPAGGHTCTAAPACAARRHLSVSLHGYTDGQRAVACSCLLVP